MMRKRFFIYYMLAFLAAALFPRPAAAQAMSSTSFHVTTQAAESGGSPTSSTSNSLSSTNFKTILNVGRAADNLKTTASLKVREGYIPTLPTPPTFSVTTTTLATAVLNASYIQTLQTSGGTPPVTWALTFGVLPTGLSLNSSTGVISGVPSVKEVQTFVVKAADSAAHTASRLFTIHVVSEGELVNPGLNTPYNISAHAFVAEGWQEFTWPGFDSPDFSRESVTILEGDSAQTLSRGNAPWRGGVFQQVPVIPGRPFTASIQAIMASGESGDGNVQIGIGLADGATTDPNLISVSHFLWDHETDLRVFNAFEATIVPAQGFVTVFLVAYNRFAFDTRVTFDAGAAGHDVALKVATSALPPTAAGLTYNVTLRATGGTGPYTWSLLLGTLPAGLSLSAAGTITGMPTTAETQAFTVQVTDSSPTPGTATRPLSIAVAPPLQITSASPLPRASLGQTYGRVLRASSGNAPVTWSIVAGALPAGLTMGGDGIIKGKATVLGTFTFTARATDSTVAAGGGPSVADKTFALSVGNVQITAGANPKVHPAIVYNPNANESLVVYEELVSSVPVNTDIMAQRLDAAMNPIGAPIAVANSSEVENRPQVAYSNTAHRYGVVFTKGGPTQDVVVGQDVGSQIHLTLLDDAGNVVLPSTQISNTTGGAREPKVTWRSANGNDQFDVIWRDNRNGQFELFSEARDATGTMVHDDTLLRSTPGVDIFFPAIVHNSADDQNMVVFAEAGNIRAIRTNGDASAIVGSTVNIQDKIAEDNAKPDIVYESFMNRYFAVWQDGRHGVSDTDVFGVILFADGSLHPPGPSLIAGGSGIQSSPRVTYNASTDGFVVVWENQTASGDIDIYARGVPMLVNFMGVPLGDVVRISAPTASPESETFNEFEPAITTNTSTGLAQIVWRDERGGVPQIFGETKRDFKIKIQTQRFFLVSGAGTSPIRVQVFDFSLDLNTLTVVDRVNGRSFNFVNYGQIETISDDRIVVVFSMNTSGLQGQSGWIDAEASEPNGDIIISNGQDPVYSQIIVTHVVFNHTFVPEDEGAGLASNDGLSIVVNSREQLEHGPGPAGDRAGEWICMCTALAERGERNEPALYLASPQQSRPSIMVRFEAGRNINTAEIRMSPDPATAWPDVPFQTVEFRDSPNVRCSNVYPILTKASHQIHPDTPNPLVMPHPEEYVEYRFNPEIIDEVRKTRVLFRWRVRDVNGMELENSVQELNISGLPTNAQVDALLAPLPPVTPAEAFNAAKGHPIFQVIDTPGTHLPGHQWYQGSVETLPWVLALDFVTRADVAAGAKTADEAASKLTSFLHSTDGGGHGVIYDTTGGAAGYTDGGTTASPRFRAEQYITLNPRFSVNCYDQASAVTTLGNLLGAGLEYRYRDPYGYINAARLVGIPGMTNNPFFTYNGGPQLNPNNDALESSIPPRDPFGNHAYVLAGTRVFDACVGPYTGTLQEGTLDTVGSYLNVGIDHDTAAERAAAVPESGTTATVEIETVP